MRKPRNPPRPSHRLALVVALALACRSDAPPPAAATPQDVHVDQRVELLCVLERLAGSREYRTAPSTTYVREVDQHFAPYANHAAVTATRELHERGLSYDAPMALAVQLDAALRVRARSDDPRFAAIDLDAYLAAVRDFAQASGFAEFFTAHRAYYQQLETRLGTAITTENPRAWFDGFFGKRAASRFIVVPAPLTGTWNYGPQAGDDRYQVMGIEKVDFDELPIIDADLVELLVHEMTHSYINPLFAKHRAELEPHGKRLFARVEEAMRQQAYPTWDIMLNESAVRAVTTLYIRDRKGVAAGAIATKREVERWFLWTESLAALLRTKYAADRTRYPDLEAFMPELVAYLAKLD